MKKLSKDKQDYYYFLTLDCFAELSSAEDDFRINRFASCATRLFHSAEFFWKALIILSGKHFDTKHEASQQDMAKIKDDLLSSNEKIKAYDVLSKFPEIRRELATYGYYEKGKISEPPSKILSKEEVKTYLDDVRWLVNKLRKIHLYQVFEPPVRTAVLSGYVENTDNEKQCLNYTWSGYRKVEEWVNDLNNIKTSNGSQLFETYPVTLAELSSGNFPLAINPFGETYPEKGKIEGVGFETISRYVRDGGIFINSGGHPFIYSWDVNTGSHQPVISFLPTIHSLELKSSEGRPIIEAKYAKSLPFEAVLLRKFDLKLIWDIPEKDIVGPKEVEVEYEKCLGDDKPKIKTMTFRPVKQLTPNVIPLVRSNTTFWGEVYPVVAVKFGRGFLVHTGMSLDGEREYRILLDIVRRIAVEGYEKLSRVD